LQLWPHAFIRFAIVEGKCFRGNSQGRNEAISPVQAPTKHELVTLGLAIPMTLLSLADAVIELRSNCDQSQDGECVASK
jgi:hypothetical protein